MISSCKAQTITAYTVAASELPCTLIFPPLGRDYGRAAHLRRQVLDYRSKFIGGPLHGHEERGTFAGARTLWLHNEGSKMDPFYTLCPMHLFTYQTPVGKGGVYRLMKPIDGEPHRTFKWSIESAALAKSGWWDPDTHTSGNIKKTHQKGFKKQKLRIVRGGFRRLRRLVP